MPRAKQKLRLVPKVRGFRVSVPESAQRLILELPVVRDQMQAERRLLILEMADVLASHGVSQRSAAFALRIPVATLVNLRERYARNGFAGLVPKRFGPRCRRNQPRPCGLYFTLTR